MSKPDITPAQLVALAASLLAVLVKVAGLSLDQEQQDAILDLVQVIAPVLIGGDAVIRFGRSRALAPGGNPNV